MNTRSELIGARPSSGAASSELSSPQNRWNLLRPRTGALRLAFTLIELLVVIAVISIIAAMIFPVTGAVNRTKVRRRAASELAQIQLAIDAYKTKLGHYPPDSPPNGANWTPWINQLYYELRGTTNNGSTYITLDGSAQLNNTLVPTLFGPGVTGFLNCYQSAGGDEARTPTSFIKDLRPSAFLFVDVPGRGQAELLGTTLEGPPQAMLQGVNGGKLNPWRYNSSSPTNNPSSYDLWVDVIIAGKTNRISNWSREPLIVNSLF
jgi:prepilin-type N-terminal cleavage/methylation domain-containing protein